IGVAISHVSEEQRLGAVVSSPHRERARYAQAHDRGLGAQAFDRLVAARARWRRAGRRHSAPDAITEVAEGTQQFRPSPSACDGSPMTIRGGGSRFVPWLLCRGKAWVRRFGASLPMRMAASWFGS